MVVTEHCTDDKSVPIQTGANNMSHVGYCVIIIIIIIIFISIVKKLQTCQQNEQLNDNSGKKKYPTKKFQTQSMSNYKLNKIALKI